MIGYLIVHAPLRPLDVDTIAFSHLKDIVLGQTTGLHGIAATLQHNPTKLIRDMKGFDPENHKYRVYDIPETDVHRALKRLPPTPSSLVAFSDKISVQNTVTSIFGSDNEQSQRTVSLYDEIGNETVISPPGWLGIGGNHLYLYAIWFYRNVGLLWSSKKLDYQEFQYKDYYPGAGVGVATVELCNQAVSFEYIGLYDRIYRAWLSPKARLNNVDYVLPSAVQISTLIANIQNYIQDHTVTVVKKEI